MLFSFDVSILQSFLFTSYVKIITSYAESVVS